MTLHQIYEIQCPHGGENMGCAAYWTTQSQPVSNIISLMSSSYSYLMLAVLSQFMESSLLQPISQLQYCTATLCHIFYFFLIPFPSQNASNSDINHDF